MKFTHYALCLTALTSAGLAGADEVAQPKNDLPEEPLQIAQPQLPQPPQTEAKTNDSHTLSISKEELAKRPDLIIRGLILDKVTIS